MFLSWPQKPISMRIMELFQVKEVNPTQTYQTLPVSSDESDIEEYSEKLPPKSKYYVFKIALFSGGFLLLLISIISLLPIESNAIPTVHSTHGSQSCGTNRNEALSHNCTFDPMSFSWLPPACYDDALTAEFLSLKPWRWTTDRTGTDPVLLEKVLAGDHANLYVSWEYHLLHCTYMWRKLHRAALGSGMVDSYIGNYNHTSHCEMMLLQEGDKEDINTVIRTKFVDCNPISSTWYS